MAGGAFSEPSDRAAPALADGWMEYAQASSDNAGKRRRASAMLDLSALAVRKRMRAGFSAAAGAKALDALWEGGEQMARNVRPELVLTATAFAVMEALRKNS